MDILTAMKKALAFMEDRLCEDISSRDVADEAGISLLFLQKGFTVMTGMTTAEYIRSRRLALAAARMAETDDKVIDIALDCFYETPESFTKAFTRFHGVTPTQVRSGAAYRAFPPFTITLSIKGGNSMNYKIAPVFPHRLIGYARIFTAEEVSTSKAIPAFWDEVYAAHHTEKVFTENRIGEYGACIDNADGSVRYLVAGRYEGGEVPGNMEVITLPVGEWAVFEEIGPLPSSIQQLNYKIWNEWLPGNPEYELRGNTSIEWYDPESTEEDKCHTAVWLPVQKKH